MTLQDWSTFTGWVPSPGLAAVEPQLLRCAGPVQDARIGDVDCEPVAPDLEATARDIVDRWLINRTADTTTLRYWIFDALRDAVLDARESCALELDDMAESGDHAVEGWSALCTAARRIRSRC